MTQQQEALCLANDARRELRDLKHALRTGKHDWRDVILNPPPILADLLLCEVLLLVPFMGRAKVELLDRRAHREGITLTVRAGRASLRTREWVTVNALVYVVGSGRRARAHSGLVARRARREGQQT